MSIALAETAESSFGQRIFTPLSLEHGLLASVPGALATELRAWQGASLELSAGATHFVFVIAGTAALDGPSGRFQLGAGMYGSLNAGGRIGGSGEGIVVSRLGYTGFFQIGGPIERRGRLRYIDGCTDSLLLSPVVCGDPCLNHLHIPPNTRQTRHTHPSVRAGVIVRGAGRCVTPHTEHELGPGLVFIIEPDGPHSFHTDGEALDVVVYHPDSDTGPTDEDHPMYNRTIVGQRAPRSNR